MLKNWTNQHVLGALQLGNLLANNLSKPVFKSLKLTVQVFAWNRLEKIMAETPNFQSVDTWELLSCELGSHFTGHVL